MLGSIFVLFHFLIFFLHSHGNKEYGLLFFETVMCFGGIIIQKRSAFPQSGRQKNNEEMKIL